MKMEKNGAEKYLQITFLGVYALGLLSLCAAIFGCFGVCLKNRVLVSIYSLLALALGLVFLILGMIGFYALINFGPQVEKDVLQTCRPTIYAPLLKELGCDFVGLDQKSPPSTDSTPTVIRSLLAAENDRMLGRRAPTGYTITRAPPARDGECGEECQVLAQKYRKNIADPQGRCKVIHFMCTEMSLRKVQVVPGLCRTIDPVKYPTAFESMDKTGQLTEDECQQMCMEDIYCKAFSYSNSFCSLVMEKKPISTQYSWTKVISKKNPVPSGNTEGAYCYQKEHHTIVSATIHYGKIASGISTTLGLFLVLTFLCSVCMVISVAKKKDGLCAKIFCPCRKTKRVRGLDEECGLKVRNAEYEDVDTDDSSSDEDEAEE